MINLHLYSNKGEKMKTRFTFIFLILIFLLAACQPATPIQESQENATEEPDGIDSQPVGEVLGDETGDENATGDFPRPEVAWNHDPETLIISGTFCCGFTTPLVPLNYIPDFQIWGDGRYIWVVFSSDNTSRQVLQGQLTEEQMTSLLEKAVNAGFFGWEDRYENNMVSDMADKCITIHLESTSKSVCEYYEGAPKAFHEMYDNLAKGSGIAGTDFVPERGYLTAFPFPQDVLRPISEDDILWPTDQLFPLTTAVDKGVWVEGDALLLAWQAINADPWNGMVRDSEGFYSLALQIPGLSMNQPPAETQ
jgi:hypothetical protein